MTGLSAKHLNVWFGSGRDRVLAVDDVSFSVASGASFGLVGESGSGKSTILRALTGLAPNWSGEMMVGNEVLQGQRSSAFYKQVQMVFQDPYASLHPRHTVDQMLSETLYQVSLIPLPVLRRSLFRLGSVQGRVTANRDASLDVSQAQLSRCSWPRASRFQSHATSLNTIHSEPHSQVFDQSASNRAKTHLRLRSHTRATTRLPSKPLQDACSAVLRAAREYKT